MPNRTKRIKLSIISALLFAGIIAVMIFFSGNALPSPSQHEVPQEKTQVAPDTFSYQGQDGVTALELLEEKTTITKTSSGFVTAINGRQAEDSQQEFWAFYVNGRAAQVGANEYITSNSDKIEWKIETY